MLLWHWHSIYKVSSWEQRTHRVCSLSLTRFFLFYFSDVAPRWNVRWMIELTRPQIFIADVRSCVCFQCARMLSMRYGRMSSLRAQSMDRINVATNDNEWKMWRFWMCVCVCARALVLAYFVDDFLRDIVAESAHTSVPMRGEVSLT